MLLQYQHPPGTVGMTAVAWATKQQVGAAATQVWPPCQCSGSSLCMRLANLAMTWYIPDRDRDSTLKRSFSYTTGRGTKRLVTTMLTCRVGRDLHLREKHGKPLACEGTFSAPAPAATSVGIAAKARHI